MNRWVLAYAPLIEKRLRAFRKPHCGSMRLDETYTKLRGEWRYLYRACALTVFGMSLSCHAGHQCARPARTLAS